MNTETGRFRQKRTSFTATSNKVLFDTNLDMDTKTLHNMITYYISIPEFTLYKAHLQKQSGVGQRAFNRMWKQLKDNGYLVQYKFKDEKGTFYYEYELLDEPQKVENKGISPEVQNVYVEKEQEKNPEVHYAHVGHADMDDAVHGKRTSINKTINNNTLSNKIINKQQEQQHKEAIVVVNADSHIAKIDAELLQEFKHAFGRKPSPKAQESLRGYLSKFEKDVVLHAIDIAGNKNKGWDYVQGILKVWWQQQVFTFDEVFEYEEQYQ